MMMTYTNMYVDMYLCTDVFMNIHNTVSDCSHYSRSHKVFIWAIRFTNRKFLLPSNRRGCILISSLSCHEKLYFTTFPIKTYRKCDSTKRCDVVVVDQSAGIRTDRLPAVNHKTPHTHTHTQTLFMYLNYLFFVVAGLAVTKYRTRINFVPNRITNNKQESQEKLKSKCKNNNKTDLAKV